MIKKIFAFLKSRIFLINLAIAIVALPLLFWIIFAWMRSYTHHNDYVLVPDFKNLKINQLASFVDDKKVDFEIIDSIWDPKLTKGIVVKQDPDPGDKVKEGRKIYLYVTSVRPPMINMPKLEDMSLRQAMAVCESYGLVGYGKEVDDPCDGCIVKQLYNNKRIEPGTLIEKGQTITLLYGKGENGSTQSIPVPNLIGMSFRAARGKMLDMGLEWMVVADPGVKDTLNAFVYSQEPNPGRDRKLVTGSTIDLRVSNDKSKINNDSIKTP
ncbi:MAG TPA: PASTA domain-containing protein [Bacteroidia bacterium]|nr:PASTA domain-containing protein [Bacteroidia bacterium]